MKSRKKIKVEEIADITSRSIDVLQLDDENARFAGLQAKASQRDIARHLWQEEHLDELLISIAINGYYKQEPLLVVKKGDKYIVVEGNRRLASVQILLDPSLAKYVGARLSDLPKLTVERSKELEELPVIIYANREMLFSYLSYRHVNGARSWSAISKAEFIADLNQKGISFENILKYTGDKNRTSIKMYNGLMVLRQGEAITRFTRSDFNARKLNFSHLYTLIQYPVTKKFLGIDKLDPSKPFPQNPVPEVRKKELEEVLIWIFGSKSARKQSLIKSQNPDLRMLDDIIGNPDALTMLRDIGDLEVAHDYTQQEDRRLESSITKSEVNIRKAKSVEDAFKGDEILVQKVKNIHDISGEMYKKMLKIIRK